MSRALPIISAAGIYVALPILIIVGWVRWASRRQAGAAWLSLTGFSLGTVSALLGVGATLYARFVGGFPFYDPALLKIYRLGILLSTAGLIFGIIGGRSSSPVRWYAPVAAAGTLLFWLAAATGE